jgi:hypothetical protein
MVSFEANFTFTFYLFSTQTVQRLLHVTQQNKATTESAEHTTPVWVYEQVFWFPARFNRLLEVKTLNQHRKQGGQMFISG